MVNNSIRNVMWVMYGFFSSENMFHTLCIFQLFQSRVEYFIIRNEPCAIQFSLKVQTLNINGLGVLWHHFTSEFIWINGTKALYNSCAFIQQITQRVTLTRNFIWKSICTNPYLELSCLTLFISILKFGYFPYGMSLFSYLCGKRIYCNSLIYRFTRWWRKDGMWNLSVEILVTLSIWFRKSHWNSHCLARQQP